MEAKTYLLNRNYFRWLRDSQSWNSQKKIVKYCLHKLHVKKVCGVGGGGGIFPPNFSVYASQDNIRFMSGEIGCLVTGLDERMSGKFLNKIIILKNMFFFILNFISTTMVSGQERYFIKNKILTKFIFSF